MVEESKLEKIAKTAKAGDKNSGSSKTIDDKLGTDRFYNKSLAGRVLDYAIGGTCAAAATALMGPAALIGPATAILGDYFVNLKNKKKLSSRQIRDNMIIGSALSIPVMHAFNLMNQYIPMATLAGKITRAVVQQGFFLPISYLANAVDYWVRPNKNKSLKNMWEKQIKPYAFKVYKDGFWWLGVPNQIAANFLPAQLHYPVSRLLGLTFRTTKGQRTLKGLDPYGTNGNSNGNGSDIEKKYTRPSYQTA